MPEAAVIDAAPTSSIAGIGDPLLERILPLAQAARGRCHSCTYQRHFDLPTGTRYYCRAYGADMTADERSEIRECKRWAPFRRHDNSGRRARASRDPVFAEILDAEDQLFAHLNLHLHEVGVDLKTLLVVAQPAIRCASEVSWVDTLDERFEIERAAPIDEILVELRALRYDSLCELLERLMPDMEVAEHNAA
jgi:hypothetical protein